MRTCHGEEGVVDDGWIGSSQLNMTEPELPTPNSYAPCRFVRNSKRSAMNCTALHRGAIRFDARRCGAAHPQLPPTSSRCFSPGSSQPDSANLEFSLTLLWGAEAVPNQAVACALCTGCAPPAAAAV